MRKNEIDLKERHNLRFLKSNARPGLPQLLDPSARSQFRALCYRRISSRAGHAVAKAAVVRLLGVPSLPVPIFLPRAALAGNCPGPADSFNFPPRSTYASSLLSSLSSPLLSSISPPSSSLSLV